MRLTNHWPVTFDDQEAGKYCIGSPSLAFVVYASVLEEKCKTQ